MKFLSKNEIWCVEHGTVRVPPNFFETDFGGYVTMYCPQCEAEARDITLDQYIDLHNQYADFEIE